MPLARILSLQFHHSGDATVVAKCKNEMRALNIQNGPMDIYLVVRQVMIYDSKSGIVVSKRQNFVKFPHN